MSCRHILAKVVKLEPGYGGRAGMLQKVKADNAYPIQLQLLIPENFLWIIAVTRF